MTYADFVSQAQTAHPEIQSSQMFGMPCLKVDGKAVAGDWQGAVVFKLSPEDAAEALKLPGAELFDPMGGRPMKQWVVVPADLADRWGDLLEQALKLRQ